MRKTPASLLFMLLLLQTICGIAQPTHRFFIANDDHTDYMWTGNEAQYDSAFVHMLDYYLDNIDSTASLPDDYQTRFNCDGSYWLRVYEKYRSPQQYRRLIEGVRSGHISVPLNLVASTYGAQPTEAVLRGMYHAGSLQRQYKVRFPLAVSMENQTLPLGLSSLWAGAGAKYSWRGVCGCATRFSNESLSHRKHQLYRYTGVDGQSVLMKWYSRVNYNGRTLGGYAETRRERKPLDPVADMAIVIADMEKLCDTKSPASLYPYNVAGAFGYGWDDLSSYAAPDFSKAAQRYTTQNRKVRVSNEVDFFEDITKSYSSFPSETITSGNEWDTYCVSMNETTARVRRATEKLRTAEALAAVVALKGIDFTKRLETLRKQAWEAYGLYWEHDWTADGPVSQKDRADWQIRLQRNITAYVDTLCDLGKEALAMSLASTEEKRFYVFNPLSWVRNDVADVEWNGGPVKVVDVSSGKELASQEIIKQNKKFIRFMAKGIPSVGYKVYELRKGSPAAYPSSIKLQGEYVSNKFFRLRIRPSGVITEWYDSLAGGRALINKTDGRFVNDLGTKNVSAGVLTVESVGPVSVTLKAVSADPLPHTVRITVYAVSPRIDIEDSIQANFGDLKTWSFAFNLTKPTTHHEELGAILTAKKEERGGHYASYNGRYDWQTFNHFADLSEKDYGITVSNLDCSFFSLGNSTPDSLWETSAQLKALAGGQTDPYTGLSKNIKDTVMMGIYRQNGQTDFLYHFALTSHRNAFDPVREMKFALEHQNPLLVQFTSGGNAASSKSSFSLLQVRNPSVLLWAIKPSEEGIASGLVARCWNFAPKAVQTEMRLVQPVSKASQVTHLEIDEKELRPKANLLTLSLGQYRLNSYRFILNQNFK